MTTALLVALATLPGRADTGASGCDGWDPGTVMPREASAHLGETREFRVCGVRSGEVDPDSCSWRVDGGDESGGGTIDPPTGSPVTWYAPTELEHCIAANYRVVASCTDPPSVSWADVTLQCDEEDKAEVRDETRSWTLAGGGCNGASPVPAALLPVVVLGGWRARRRRRR